MNRNLHLPVKLASLLIMIALLVMPGVGWGQTPIFTESIGTVSATTTIAAHEAANGFDNDAYTMTGGGATNPADIRATSTSSGYTGASGAANVWFTSTNAEYGFAIEGIDASSYTDLTVQFGYRKESATLLPTLNLQYWNGTSYNNVPFAFSQAANAATGWYLSPVISLPEGAQISGLRLRWLKSGSIAVRIDDVVLSGVESTSTAATPTFSPVAGTFYSAQNVTLSCETENSTIYYTTDGSDPDNTDTEYTAAIPVISTTTIKAIAYATGYDPSEIATATYTIVTQFAVTFYVDMSNQTGFTTVDIAGSFNDWGNPGYVMTDAGNGIYTYTTDAVFTAGQEILFKFRKNGDWGTSEPDPNRTYTVVAGPDNDYHSVYGVMVPAAIGWANLQWPDAGTITAGGNYDVYARIYMAGVTEPAGQGANISAWIGYSTSDTDPSTWTNWVAASFNEDAGNDDEYMANIATGLAPETYYYASRFQYSDLSYVYGGFNGGFWDGTTNISGVLTVNALPVVVPNVIISEVYGGGGNSGATYTHDFIELYNTTASPVDISGWSVQYYGAATTGLSTNVFVIPSDKTIPAYAHFLIQAAQGTGGTTALPTPDAISTLAMGAAAGKVILYTTSEAQTISDLTSITGNTNFKDYVPYGATAVPIWGSATAVVTNTTSATRKTVEAVYVYTQNIGNDFEVVAPTPKNSSKLFRSKFAGDWELLTNWESSGDGTVWGDATSLPSATDNVTIDHAIAITGTADCDNLTIGMGSLVVNSGGSLIPNGTVTGDVTVIRNIAGLNQYHFISSPISNADLGNVFPAGDELNIYLREYDEAAGNWVNLTIPATLANGKGYSFFMDIASTTATFTGTLNNADLMPMMSNSGTSGNTNYDGWNLLGNPFASAIQWGLGSWAPINVNDEVHVWSNGVYLSYSGGAGSLTDGIIPAQQGFFVKANNTEPSLTIPTASRLHSSQGFYKNNIADLLRLDVSDNSTYSDATFVRFSFDATEEFDATFDAHKLDNDEAAPMLYTMHGETRFSINTLRSISETPEVPVYFKAGTDGGYTINASGMESFENRIIYLTDLLTGLRQDLRQNPVYAFNASVGDDANRFKLSFATLGIGEQPGLNIGVYAVDGQIRLLLPEAMKGTVNITNLSGQALYSRNFSASGELGINASFPAGVYLVSVVTAQGTATRKVFVN